MKRMALIMLAACFTAACSNPIELPDNLRKEVAGEVQAMMYACYADVREHGLQAEFKYIDNSGRFFWVPPGADAPLSFDTVLAMITRNAARLRMVNNSLDTLVVSPLSSTLAVYSARIRSVTTDTLGRDTTIGLVETGTVVKRKDGWKLLCGQTTTCNLP